MAPRTLTLAGPTFDLAALGDHPERRREAHAVPFGLVVEDRVVARQVVRVDVARRLPAEQEAVGAERLDRRAVRAVERHGERQAARSVAGEANDDRIVRSAREHLADVADLADAVVDTHDAGVEVELAPVVGDVLAVIERRAAGRRAAGTTR